MQRVLAVAFKAAPSDATVLLSGESGAGKSQLARAVHQRSGRAIRPFITVSCRSLSWDALEEAILGNAKDGTLFFDEIGELAPEIQPQLVRLLQERDGETTYRRSAPRVIAATNRDLREAIALRTFREDLYYRLNVISLEIPPLRHRMEDFDLIVNALVNFFASQSGKPVKPLSAAHWRKLHQHPWPGNLRELQRVIERAVFLSNGDEIALPDFAEPPQLPVRVASGLPCTLEDIGNEHIRQVLAKTRSIKAAARILGIDLTTLYRKRKKLGSS